jgi:hypothetical protein
MDSILIVKDEGGDEKWPYLRDSEDACGMKKAEHLGQPPCDGKSLVVLKF